MTRSRRDLPWRESHDFYRVWISEIMLQQTRVEAVIPYYRRFLERFPFGGSLAAAPEAAVLAAWSGLGYYSRARNLHRAARQIAAAGVPGKLRGGSRAAGRGAIYGGGASGASRSICRMRRWMEM